MICRAVLVRVAQKAVSFSCRLIRRALRSARRELRWMKTCDARVSFVAANLALATPLEKPEPSQPRVALLRVSLLGRRRLNRGVHQLSRSRRPGRLLVLSR